VALAQAPPRPVATAHGAFTVELLKGEVRP
jgi:hypothetical protein